MELPACARRRAALTDILQISSRIAGHDVIVRVVGPLTTTTSAQLGDHLLRAAAEQPATLVCDLRHALATPAALSVLVTVLDQVAVWPACPLILIADDDTIRAQLHDLGLDRRATVVSPITGAPAVVGAASAHTAVRHLTPHLSAARAARTFVREHLTRWGHDALVDDAALVVSELVTNAVLHAGTDIKVVLTSTLGRISIAVADSSPTALDTVRRPRSPAGPGRPPRGDRSDDEHGRGLALVAGYATRWGHTPRHPTGKVVWATLNEP